MRMPNKTIYIKDSDLPVWTQAQKELGESLSSGFVDYLKERLKSETRNAGKIEEVQAMKDFLDEINIVLNLNLELHPSWRYPILDQTTLNHGFKLHQKNANPDRIMSLVIWPLDFDSAGRPNPMVKREIKIAVKKFWDGQTTENHRFVDVASANGWIEYDPENIETHPEELDIVECEFDNGRRGKGPYSRAAGRVSIVPSSIKNPIGSAKIKRWRLSE